MNLRYSEEVLTETQTGFQKGRSFTDPTLCLKLLIGQHRQCMYNLTLRRVRESLTQAYVLKFQGPVAFSVCREW